MDDKTIDLRGPPILHTPSAGGEMRARVRDLDWTATPLGNPKSWPIGLKLSVDLILASGFPMAVRWGPDLVVIYNDAYRDILGDKHPEALGRPLREVWPEIHDRLGPLSEAILRGERDAFFAEDHPWDVRRRGGALEHAHFTVSYSPIPEPTAPHQIGGVMTVCFETTQRVRNEERLRVLSHDLEAEIERRNLERDRVWSVSEDLLGVGNFEGYFLSVNPAWTKVLGWSEAQIKAMHVSALRHPDDTPAAVAARARLAQGTHTVRIENRLRHKNGSWRWIAWTVTADDGLIYVAGRDVTSDRAASEALRQSDRQFRSLVTGVQDYALIMLDTQGIISSWNPGAERIKGYSEGEIVGRHFSCFYTEADRADGVPARALATARTTGRYEAESWRARKDGSLFYANVVIDAIHDDAGRLVAFAKITRDITERREAQAALERTRQQLTQAQKMEALGQLTGGVAHDFNNLLMVVAGQANILRRRMTDAKDVRALDAILTAAARGESLTRQLLTFARRQPINPTVIAPANAIAAIHDVLASSIDVKIELAVAIPATIWPLRVDTSELELALVNLVVNARDAMPDGGKISISAENVRLSDADTPEQLSGDFVALSIADSGQGMSPDVLPKVFEPFFTTKQPGKGTGLGLSQVYGFARQSGGTVTVVSELGHGTTVTIFLPRSLEAVVATASEGDTGEDIARGQEVVLVVEDNPDVRAVAIELLEQLGYRTIAFGAAAAALDALASGMSPDLVFSDIVLPGELDGLALARAVKERHPGIPVLLATGYARALSSELRFAVLRKPYQIAALGRAVRDAIDARRTTRSARPG